jgi:hypothetical protein
MPAARDCGPGGGRAARLRRTRCPAAARRARCGTTARRRRHGTAWIVRRAASQAGIAKRVGPHMLRHALITSALDAVVPLREVQEAASEADPRTTMRYDPAPRWSGTPPTSWPPTSLVQLGRQHEAGADPPAPPPPPHRT